MATENTLRKQIKGLLASLEGDELGANALCSAISPLMKRNSKDNALSELIEALEKRDHATLWKGVQRHVDAVVANLQARSGGDDGVFDPVGRAVCSQANPGVRGVVVDLDEGEDGDILCKATFDDGSEELFPFHEARARTAEAGNGDDSEEGAAGADIESDGLSSEGVEALAAVANFALAWLQHRSKGGLVQVAAPPAMLATAEALHGVLFDLNGLDGLACQEAIAKMCECWWVDERAGAELLMPQLLMYLLVQALGDESRDADLKRLFAVRGALALFDFDDSSADTIRSFLLQCAAHPKFLMPPANNNKGGEGRKFLVFLFGLHPSLVDGLHRTIKNQLPLANLKVQRFYGDLYLRAWKSVAAAPAGSGAKATQQQQQQQSSVYRRAVEACLQDLMHAAVHAAQPKTAAACRACLGPLHVARGSAFALKLDATCTRLWEPILWRSLKVANPTVRTQAAEALRVAFPLTGAPGDSCSGLTQEEAEEGTGDDVELLQRQFDALKALLEDQDPRVRAAACGCVATVLRGYWESIPPTTSRVLLTALGSTLAQDRASPLVRVAAVQALTELLEQPLAHTVLRTFLPSLKLLMHDHSDKVRLAMVALLQRVSTVRGIQFVQVVPVNHLHARLALDFKKASSRAVASATTRLLAPSYFPSVDAPNTTASTAAEAACNDENSGAKNGNAKNSNDDDDDDEKAVDQSAAAREKQHLGRCLAFLKENPSAATAFYSCAHEHVALPTLSRLVVLLVAYAHTAASAAVGAESQAGTEAATSGGGGEGAADQEEEEENEGQSGALAATTPDKRSKRSRQGKGKGSKKDKAAAAKAKAPAASPADVAASRRLMVNRVLACAGEIWASLLPLLARADKQGSSSSKPKGRNGAAVLEAVECRASLSEGVGSALPELYALLVEAGPAWASARARCLRLAACLPSPNDVPDLLPLLMSGLQASNQGQDFAPAVALLCKWGLTSTVVGLISDALTAALPGDNTTLQGGSEVDNVDHDEENDHDDDAASRAKRKRALKNKKKTKTAVTSTAAAEASSSSSSGSNEATLAVHLLSFLCAGRDSLALEAREAMLQDPSAHTLMTAQLAKLLPMIAARAKQQVEGEGDEDESAPDAPAAGAASDNELLVALEVYGRLLTHQAASSSTEDDEGHSSGECVDGWSSGMDRLLSWATHDLVPLALQDGTASALSSSSSAEAEALSATFSPPAKASRAGTPAKGKRNQNNSNKKKKKAAVGGAAAGKNEGEEEDASSLSGGPNLAAKACAVVMATAGDWARCGVGLASISEAARSMSLAVLDTSNKQASSSGDNNDNDDDKELHSGSDLVVTTSSSALLLPPLCRLAYVLAVQEPNNTGAVAPEAALQIMLRGAHIATISTATRAHGSSDAPHSGPRTLESTATTAGAGAGSLAVQPGSSPREALIALLTLAVKRGTRNLRLLVTHVANHLLAQVNPLAGGSDEATQYFTATSAQSATVVLETLLANRTAAKVLVNYLLQLADPNAASSSSPKAPLLLAAAVAELKARSSRDAASAELASWAEREMTSAVFSSSASPNGHAGTAQSMPLSTGAAVAAN